MANKMKLLDSNGLLYLWGLIKAKFVAKESGKGLSANDYTDADRNKLAGLANTAVVDDLTSTSASAALAANQGRVLRGMIEDLALNSGAGDMLASVYDANGDGVVDNAAKLGGQLPSYYAPASSIPTDNAQLANGAGYRTAEQVASAIASAVSSTYKAAGSVAFSALPTPSAALEGNVYNVTTAFVTTSQFVEGAGHEHVAGTNVAVIEHGGNYLFDVMAGMIDLSGYLLAADMQPITNAEIDAICV